MVKIFTICFCWWIAMITLAVTYIAGEIINNEGDEEEW